MSTTPPASSWRGCGELTGGYTSPADGCTSYEMLYRGLAELEADTHLHVHKENNVLFPMVERIERQLEP